MTSRVSTPLTLADRRSLDNMVCLAYLDGDLTWADMVALLITVRIMRGQDDPHGVLNGWRR